jgi:hypothetical protein
LQIISQKNLHFNLSKFPTLLILTLLVSIVGITGSPFLGLSRARF